MRYIFRILLEKKGVKEERSKQNLKIYPLSEIRLGLLNCKRRCAIGCQQRARGGEAAD